MTACSRETGDGVTNDRLTIRSALILTLFTAILVGTKLGSYRVLTLHEILFAQPAKEMLASGNWIHATIGGQPSDHKPLMTHWSIAAAMAVFQSDSPWVVRLPNALASLFSSLIIAWVAGRWFGDRIGLWTGMIQSSTLYFSLQSRLAESDMLLCLAVTGAMASFMAYVIATPRGTFGRGWLPAAFYSFAGVAFLTKGPVGLVFIFGGTCAWTLLTRDRRSFRLYFDPFGLLLFLVFLLAWPIAAYVTRPEILEAWKLHHLQRFSHGLDGRKDTFYYYYHIPYLLLPWAPLLFVGLWRVIKVPDYRSKLTLFLATWFAVGFTVLSLAAFKHKHYLIPILPPLSIVMAWGLEYVRNLAIKRWALVSGAAFASFAGLVGIGILLLHPQPWSGVVLAAIAIGLAGMLVSLGLYDRQRWNSSIGAAFVTAGLLIMTIQGYLMPYFDDYRDQTDVAIRAGELAPTDQPIYVVDLGETQALFYLRHALIRVDHHDLLEQSAGRSDSSLYVLGTAGTAEALESLGAVEVLDRCVSMRPYMKESERMVFMRVDRTNHLGSKPQPATVH